MYVDNCVLPTDLSPGAADLSPGAADGDAALPPHETGEASQKLLTGPNLKKVVI